ncbi:YwqI/YxiC family protein [Terribacillus sp. DMT04]|uniref:YwqI/YxiC family protein n=1 Tax=Terribacillus sp. DMT04 TaxID=2850441 RepID=UPI001C2C902D|nr:YwqI/YxiC family protein [Terribacillus sp. DMT04]QXE01468.1 YwqI/YxiC family protein [Terribacillus sp. DMT04]
MSEIKLQASLVQQKLADLKAALADFQAGNPDSGGGREMLDVQAKINDLNDSLNNLIQDYQQMALQHAEASTDVVDSLENLERTVANMIIGLK